MLDENFNRLKRSSNIHITHVVLSFIHSFFFFQMAAYKGAVVMVLTELLDSDDEKPRRGKAREWIKRRTENGYFQNKFQESNVEFRMDAKDMFRMSATDNEFL